MGVAIVCGQLLISAARIRHLAASATRSSHSVRRCGSSASDFTVRMPKIVSVITVALLISAWINRPMAALTGPGTPGSRSSARSADAMTSQVSVLLR